MEPTQTHANGKMVLTLVVILVIVAAIVFIVGKTNMDKKPVTLDATDPETSQLSASATSSFAATDDTAALETDLNASINDLSQ
jgi:hypothetical protein